MATPAPPVHVLYLGMAHDIMAPLLLVPDLDVLYAIDMFDDCFSPDRTLAGQQRTIKRVLTDGSDEHSYAREIHDDAHAKRTSRHYQSIHRLDAPATLVCESTEGKTWRLDFMYNGKLRKLVFFNNHNFLATWPDEVQQVAHIIGIGAFAWHDTFKGKLHAMPLFIKMLQERTTATFSLYVLAFLNSQYTDRIRLHYGNERTGDKIATTTVKDKTAPNWHLQLCGDSWCRKCKRHSSPV